ncbi:MAG: hypothetical protein PHS57_10380 [Alphaproteobacteria bacterium]|nr:hypothetical protein [Alphaproteobacteria bacterium]
MIQEETGPRALMALPDNFVNEAYLMDMLLEPYLEATVLRADESGLTPEDAENAALLKAEFFPRLRHVYHDKGLVDREWLLKALDVAKDFHLRRASARYRTTTASRPPAACLVDLALWKASTLLQETVRIITEEAKRNGFI